MCNARKKNKDAQKLKPKAYEIFFHFRSMALIAFN